MPHDPAQALEPFRSYLEVLARVHLNPRLRGKVEPADVVQQVMLRAFAAWPDMKEPEKPALAAWLRRILARTLADLVKHYDRDKRAVALERSLKADLDQSASGMAGGWRRIRSRRARLRSATRKCFGWQTRWPHSPSRCMTWWCSSTCVAGNYNGLQSTSARRCLQLPRSCGVASRNCGFV